MTDYELLAPVLHPRDRDGTDRDARDFQTNMAAHKYHRYYQIAHELASLDRIFRSASPPRIGEIGVRFGYSLWSLANGYHDATHEWPELLYGIDDGSRESDWSEWVLTKLRPLMPDTKIHLHATNSQVLLALLERDLDICHIDGSHETAHCRHDMGLGWTALANGGLLLIDDIRHSDLADVVLDFAEKVDRTVKCYPTCNGLAVIQK